MKKFLLLVIFVASMIIAGYALLGYLYPNQDYGALQLLPKNAVFIVETDEPVATWQKISNSKIWHHLRKQPYFAALTESANSLSQLIETNPELFNLLGSRTIVSSAHVYLPKEYDFLHIVDLESAAKLQFLQNYLTHLPVKGYKITQKDYKDYKISAFTNKQDGSVIYVTFVGNLLLCSFQSSLIEAAIDEKNEPTIAKDEAFIDISEKVHQAGLFRLYLHYAYLDNFYSCYAQDNEHINKLSEQLQYTGANFTLDTKGTMTLRGFTNVNDSVGSFFKALLLSGRGQLAAHNVIPQRTAFYFSLNCNNFRKFYENLETVLKDNFKEWDEYKYNIQKTEQFLGINLQKNFIDWIGQEISFVQTQPKGLGQDNEFAVIFKAKDIDQAKENLQFISNQIRKKAVVVKIKEVDYNGYKINYLAVKGFFKLFLGSFFEKLDKPYFTIIDDYVIFSNHPQTLKNLINDYVAGSTLAKDGEFEEFLGQFKSASNVFVYAKTPILHNNMRSLVAADTWQQMNKNRQYITCFRHIGMQLSSDDDEHFATQITSSFTDDPAKLQVVPPVPLVVLDSTAESNEVDEIVIDDLDADEKTENYPDGKQKMRVKIRNGMKNGTYREYHPNGELKVKGEYEDDQKNGTWKFYDEKGKLIAKKKYKKGKEIKD
jgi:hypothetical protein